MTRVDEMTVFFGWCTVINISMFAFATIFLILFEIVVISLHSKLLGISALALPKLYFTYLAHYKIAVLMLNIAPYIALKLMV